MRFDEQAYARRHREYLRTVEKLRGWPFGQLITRIYPDDNLAFPSDQTLLITEIAVPPQPHDEHDALRVIVGNKAAFHGALKPLIDSYPVAPIAPAAELQLTIEQQFSKLISAAAEAKVDVDALEKLRELHAELWLKTPFVGVAVQIVVPPRVNIRFEVIEPETIPPRGERNQLFRGYTRKDSGLEIYLRGYFSRDVA